MTKLVDYYDEDKWGEQILTKDELYNREKKSIQIIKDTGIKKGKFLDVGCGVGFFMQKLDEGLDNNKLELWGVDYSDYNLKQAKKLPYKFKKGNIEEDGLPFKDKEVDFVYAAELIEHLVDPDYFLEESHRILKKGGHLLVTTPNLAVWYNRILLALGIQPMFLESSTRSPKVGAGILRGIKQGNIPVGHIRIFTIRAMKDLLEAQGFEVVKVRGAHFAALPKPVRWIDDIFTLYPRLSSGMLILARKK